ncbi:helix-turn-helix domain-containing protein [Patescibacteria group bacterium]|nr:helix-turn-helix domain-containing protein [Patescibacteria group bacterium]
MDKKIITIGEAAKLLNVNIMTLRRWDKQGKLKPVRFSPKGYRFYDLEEIELMLKNIFVIAKKWITAINADIPDQKYYCQDSQTFNSRLNKLETELQKIDDLKDDFSLVTSVVGEIGNNSFDHNFGQWPDVRGILFTYDLNKRELVLADRGQGVLETLKRVKPELADNKGALRVAFTERISGRAPENRGNGLKYVRKVITKVPKGIAMKLYFHSGDAALNLKNGDKELNIFAPDFSFRGCLAFIKF